MKLDLEEKENCLQKKNLNQFQNFQTRKIEDLRKKRLRELLRNPN